MKDLLIPSEEWHLEALCAQADPEEWYPESRASNRAAKAICNDCPVRQECLDFAMATESSYLHRWGIWGGLTARDRENLARQRRKQGAA